MQLGDPYSTGQKGHQLPSTGKVVSTSSNDGAGCREGGAGPFPSTSTQIIPIGLVAGGTMSLLLPHLPFWWEGARCPRQLPISRCKQGKGEGHASGHGDNPGDAAE